MCVLNYAQSLELLRRLATFIENTMTYSNLTNGPLEGLIIKSNSLKGYLLVIDDNLRNRIIITSHYLPQQQKEIKQPKVAISILGLISPI